MNSLAALALVFCNSGCTTSGVVNRVAFHPPNPYSYIIEDPTDPQLCLLTTNRAGAPIKKYVRPPTVSPLVAKTVWLSTSLGTRTLGLHVTWETKSPKITILYLHGNAADLGQLGDLCFHLAQSLEVNVLCVEYSGYGPAWQPPPTGTRRFPSIQGIHADARAGYEYLVEKCGLDAATQIVPYGQSLGSVPAAALAARRPVAGTVLHSPLSSALRLVLLPRGAVAVRLLGWADVLSNVDMLRRVKKPVLILHGEDDREIPLLHGRLCQEAVPPPYRREPVFVACAGHNDLLFVNHDLCMGNLAKFVRSL